MVLLSPVSSAHDNRTFTARIVPARRRFLNDCNHQPADREVGLGIDATVEPSGGGIGTSLLATNIDHKYLFGL